MNDSEIIELYWRKDPRAVALSIDKYGSYCFSVANNILHNEQDAEECVNDTWLKTWEAIPPSRPEVLRMFLAKITRRLSFDRYKAAKTRKRGGGEIPLVLEELSECIAAESDVEGQVDANELGRVINLFVGSLPERERNLFVRRYFFSESMKEIASRFGMSENNVTVILSRVRKKLRIRLEEECMDEQD